MLPAMTVLLVATDLSPAAAAVPAIAREWARRLGAEIALLHVVHDPELAPALAQDVGGEIRSASAALDRLALAMPDVAVTRDVVTAEDVVGAILDFAQQRGAAWLLVGTHGRSGLERLRLGSVAASLVRRCRIPIVCVPPAAHSVDSRTP